MADIYQFPAGAIDGIAAADAADTAGRMTQESFDRTSAASAQAHADAPDEVLRAVESVRRMTRIDGIQYREIPVPLRLADYGIGVGLDVPSDELGYGDAIRSGVSGWIMTLYDREPRKAWRSHWRCVAFVCAPLPGPSHDALAADMVWDAVTQSLESVEAVDPAGTVTITRNAGYGALADDGTAGTSAGAGPGAPVRTLGFEVRVSWTPATMGDRDPDVGAQVAAWARFAHDAAEAIHDGSGL